LARVARRIIHPWVRIDPFIAGLTYAEYFALSEAEQDALWEQLFAEAAVDMETPLIPRCRHAHDVHHADYPIAIEVVQRLGGGAPAIGHGLDVADAHLAIAVQIGVGEPQAH